MWALWYLLYSACEERVCFSWRWHVKDWGTSLSLTQILGRDHKRELQLYFIPSLNILDNFLVPNSQTICGLTSNFFFLCVFLVLKILWAIFFLHTKFSLILLELFSFFIAPFRFWSLKFMGGVEMLKMMMKFTLVFTKNFYMPKRKNQLKVWSSPKFWNWTQ